MPAHCTRRPRGGAVGGHPPRGPEPGRHSWPLDYILPPSLPPTSFARQAWRVAGSQWRNCHHAGCLLPWPSWLLLQAALPPPHLQEAGESLHSGVTIIVGPHFVRSRVWLATGCRFQKVILFRALWEEKQNKISIWGHPSAARFSQQELAAVATLEPQGEFCSSCFCLKLPPSAFHRKLTRFPWAHITELPSSHLPRCHHSCFRFVNPAKMIWETEDIWVENRFSESHSVANDEGLSLSGGNV